MLVGDSIRLGYGKFVELAFDGVAQVVQPKENCRFSAYHIRYTKPWLDECSPDRAPDLIHFNVGLWDLLHMVDGKVHTEIPQYAKNLERIVGIYKKLVPESKLIFALSTPVIDNPNKRLNSEIDEYNAAAREVMEKHGIEVNDLNALLRDKPDSIHSDVTHFKTIEGSKLLTERVVDVCGKALGITGKPLDYYELFDIPKEILGE